MFDLHVFVSGNVTTAQPRAGHLKMFRTLETSRKVFLFYDWLFILLNIICKEPALSVNEL